MWLSNGQQGLNPRVGEGVNRVVFPLPATTRAESTYSEGNLGTLPGILIRPKLTTDAYTIDFRTLKVN